MPVFPGGPAGPCALCQGHFAGALVSYECTRCSQKVLALCVVLCLPGIRCIQFWLEIVPGFVTKTSLSETG